MATIDFVFKSPNYGRTISDDKWETIEPAHIELWKSAGELLSNCEIPAREESYTIDADWSPILRLHKRHYAAMRFLLSGKHASLDQAYKKARFPQRTTRNRIAISVKSKGHSEGKLAPAALESFLHDVFLILNVAAPGSCDFNRASLQGPSLEIEISLSNIHFESGLLVYLDHGWPKLDILDLRMVITWFRSVRQGTSQIPKNSMERVLFALLHMSKVDTSPMIVIWLFYAFESLLQTNVGENFSAIVRRLSLLLEADENQTKIIRKAMRELYDLRSSIVHGGLEISHPAHNELLDKRVEERFVQLINATDMGHALLLSALQKIVSMSWKLPKFREILDGEAMT
jgi:hypothetical protein